MTYFGGPNARELALAEIARYSPREAASIVGALCLIPQNLHSLGRLESLAHCCVSSVPSGRLVANRTNVSRLLATMGAWVGYADDPADFVGTEAFTFHGGTHVLIGPSPLSAYTMRLLGDLTLQQNAPAPASRKRLAQLLCLIGAVSSRLAERAGLRRNLPVPPMAVPLVPHGERLQALQRAVVFSADEWTDLLARFGLRDQDLGGLISRQQNAAVDMFPFRSKALARHPLLRVGTETIVVAPHRLADAACCEARALIARDESHEELAAFLHAMTWFDVEKSLRRLGLEKAAPWAVERSASTGSFLAETVFAWDSNRLAHVVVLSDACVSDDAEWEPIDALQRAIAGRTEVEARYSRQVPRLEEVFTLLLIAPIGGAQDIAIAKGVQSPSERPLVMSSCELQTICLGLDDADPPRFLGRFARARHDLVERGCDVQAWSELDVVAAWRASGHRFMIGPTHIAVTCDYGQSLREAALARTDRHAVPGPRGAIVEVEVAEDPTLPIYGRRGGERDVPQVVVEVFDRFFWFELRASDDIQADDWSWALQCLRMCAYWTAELGLDIPLRKQANSRSVVLVQLEPSSRTDAKYGDYAFDVERGRVVAHVSPALTERYDNTNAVERQFAGELLWALLQAIGDGTREAVHAAIERRAPLGPKRMMHSVNTADVPEYHFSDGLPEPLFVHEADSQRISRWVMEQDPISSEGEGLSGEEARAWLNQSVKRLLTHLRAKVAELDSTKLLTRLMLNAERLIFELAQEEVTLASQIACHGRAPDFASRLRTGASRRAAASAATRFLIELVAAERHQRGSGHPGDSDVQFLLAIAVELITLGAASDVVRYELGIVQLRYDDGYLALSRGAYDVASGSVGIAVLDDQLAREGTRTTVGRIGSSSQRTRSEDARWQRLSEGLVTEFGVSFEQFSAFIGAVLQVWREGGTTLLTIAKSSFIERVSASSGVSMALVTRLFNCFVMRPRESYLNPPSPLKPSDVYPWHVNRPLSYLQRPFICDDSDTVRFTGGHVHRAWVYVLLLMASGRYKATTKALRDAMSGFTEAAGDEFNEEVARILRSFGLSARSKAKKFGTKRIQDEAGRDLGDVDVLAINDAAKVIYVVECKNMSRDRAPHQVKGDLDTLFLGSGAKASSQEKHLHRVRWVEANVEHVLLCLNRQPGPWKIEAVLVLSEPLQASLLGHAKLRVLSVADLKRGLSALGAGPRTSARD